MRYEIAGGAVVDRVADETAVTLPTGDVAVLNEAASTIFDEMIKYGDLDAESIAALLARRYSLGEHRAKRDVRVCLSRLRAEGVIVPSLAGSAPLRHFNELPLFTRRTFAAGALAAAVGLVAPGRRAFAADLEPTQDGGKFGFWANEETSGGKRLWEDPRGFKISLPEHIQKVAPVGAFAHSVMETIDPSMIVHVTNWGMRASAASGREELSSELEESAGMCLCEYAVETEEPDILLSILPFESRLAQNEAVSRNDAGVPVVHMVVGADSLPEAYEALGDLFGSQRAMEIASYLRDISEMLAWGSASIPLEEKRSVYIGMGELGLDSRGSDTVLDAMLRSTGALNAAAVSQGSLERVGTDAIRQWSPDLVILCPGGSSFERRFAEDEQSVWLDGELSDICPVLAEPTVPYGWLDRSPLVMYTIGALWVAHMLYPEIHTFDINEVAAEFWDLMFGVSLEPDDVHATAEAAALALKAAAPRADDETGAGAAESGEDGDPVDDGYESPQVEIISSQVIASTQSVMSSGGGSGGGGGGGAPTPTLGTQFKNVLQNQFGFDETRAVILLTVLDDVEDFCSSLTNRRDLYVAYIYFRIIGGFVYGNDDLIDSLKWSATAGDANGIYNSTILGLSPVGTASEEIFFTEKLNLASSQYKRLRYHVRLQHELCGKIADATKQYFDNNNSYYDSCKTAYLQAYDLSSLDDGTFKPTWKSFADRMCVMPDFCHFCITTATHLASELGLTVAGDLIIGIQFASVCSELGGSAVTRESLAGWLGDAVLPDDALQGNPSFGWDDYWADVDALRIARRLPINSYDVRYTITNYFPSSATCFTRRSYFKQYFSVDTAARAIADGISLLGVSDASDLAALLQQMPRYEDTLRFVQTLRSLNPEGSYRGSGI